MDITISTRRWLLIAEKLLAKENIEECHQVCNEIEILIDDMKAKGIEPAEVKLSEEKEKHIRLKLNSLIAKKIRSEKNNNHKPNLPIMETTNFKVKKGITQCIIMMLLFIPAVLSGQGVVITKESGGITEPHESAILELRSDDKGILIPRLTTLQRVAIVLPANGLMVFDTDENQFYYFDNTAQGGVGGWVTAAGTTSWDDHPNYVFTGKKVSVGGQAIEPSGSFAVSPIEGSMEGDPLFQVKNEAGEVVFAIYRDRVQIIIEERTEDKMRGAFAVSSRTGGKTGTKDLFVVDPEATTVYIDDAGQKMRGGFAVSSRTGSKDGSGDFFRVEPNLTQVFVEEGGVDKMRGGFAVSSRTGSKELFDDIFLVTPDKTRVYLKQNSGKMRGGFAVSSRTGSKGGEYENQSSFQDNTDISRDDNTPEISRTFEDRSIIGDYDFLFVDRSRTEIFIDDDGSKMRGGFAVSGRTGSKNEAAAFMLLTPENYLIGHRTGEALTTGTFNSFIGYEAGIANTSGEQNIFFGYRAGHSNTGGRRNVFIGYRSGFSNIGVGTHNGDFNVFVGDETGSSNTSGHANTFIGFNSGLSNTTGSRNVFIGSNSGQKNEDGVDNIAIGLMAGFDKNLGDANIFIGRSAGYRTENTDNVIFIGNNAGYSSFNSSNSIFIGYQAGWRTRSENNIFIGYRAGGTLERTGSNNIYIGDSTALNNSSGSRNIFIGQKAGYNETGSNKLYIENSPANSQNALIYGEFDNKILSFNGDVGIGTVEPTQKLDVDGQIRIRGGSPGAGKVLTSNANGVATWETSSGGGGGYLWTEGTGSNIYRTTGNVGIGTDSPNANLHISKDTYNEDILRLSYIEKLIEYDWGFRISNSGGLSIFEDNTARFSISEGGNVGIGTNSPNSKMHIVRTYIEADEDILSLTYNYKDIDVYDWGFRVSNDGALGVFEGETERFLINEGGNVGIGVNDATEKLDVNGKVRVRDLALTVDGQLGITEDGVLGVPKSDKRLKENIKTIDGSLEKVMNLRGVTFTWKDNAESGNKIGFIAQEMNEVLPELVFTNNSDDYLGVNYAEMTAVLVEAIKEQQQVIENQQSLIDKQSRQIDNVSVENQNLQNQINEILNMLEQTAEK